MSKVPELSYIEIVRALQKDGCPVRELYDNGVAIYASKNICSMKLSN